MSVQPGEAQQFFVVASGRFADYTETVQSVILGVADKLVELLFNLVGPALDHDSDLAIRGSCAGVDCVAVELLFSDVEVDH